MTDAYSIIPRAGVKRRVNVLGRSRQGCLTCRKKHVKCDERRTECGRCHRLDLNCVFPTTEKQFQNKLVPQSKSRPLKPRPSGLQSQHDIPSNCHLTEPSGNAVFPFMSADDFEEILLSDNAMNDLLSTGPFILQEHPTTQSPASQIHRDNTTRPWDSVNFSETDLLLDGPMPNLTQIPQSIIQKPRSGSLVLGPHDHLALKSYRTSFALSQTLKDPDWSLPSLILHSISKNKMSMHLALAVSFQHISTEQFSTLSMFHFQEGFELLRIAVIEGNSEDKISILSSFYFAFVFTLLEDEISLQRLEDLSLWSINYIRRFKLDSIASGLGYSNGELREEDSQIPGGKDPGNLTIIARLVVWLYKEDVRSVLMGGPGYIGRRFRKIPEELMNIWRFSRPALQLHWGILYPVSQSLNDLEMSQVVDMGVELLLLRYEVTACWDSSTDFGTPREVKMWFHRLAIKYDLIFQIAASTLPLPRSLHSYSTVIIATFYALKLVFHRVRSSDSQNSEYMDLKVSLLTAIQNCLAFDEVIDFEGTQWVLLIAAMEIDDIEHHKWLMGHIRISQYRYAAQRAWEFRRANINLLFSQSAFAKC